MMTDVTAKVMNFHRSAQAPVTIVRAVSMNTISKINITITPTSYVCPARKYPLWPNSPQVLPNNVIACSDAKGWSPPRLLLPAAPPICMANPRIQYANKPHVYTKKFIMYVWLAFFTRHKPDSTMAKPACMNITRKPHTSVQTKLTAILFCPTWLATSGSVTPAFESAAGTSLMVPVRVPPGSPFARSAVAGALPAASFNSASAGEVATALGAAAGVAAAVWAWASTLNPNAKAKRQRLKQLL